MLLLLLLPLVAYVSDRGKSYTYIHIYTHSSTQHRPMHVRADSGASALFRALRRRRFLPAAEFAGIVSGLAVAVTTAAVRIRRRRWSLGHDARRCSVTTGVPLHVHSKRALLLAPVRTAGALERSALRVGHLMRRPSGGRRERDGAEAASAHAGNNAHETNVSRGECDNASRCTGAAQERGKDWRQTQPGRLNSSTYL